MDSFFNEQSNVEDYNNMGDYINIWFLQIKNPQILLSVLSLLGSTLFVKYCFCKILIGLNEVQFITNYYYKTNKKSLYHVWLEKSIIPLEYTLYKYFVWDFDKK